MKELRDYNKTLYMVLLKILFLIGIAVESYINSIEVKYIIIFVLICIINNMIYILVEKLDIMLIINSIFIIVYSIFFMRSAIFFFAINMYEFVYIKNINKKIGLIIIIIPTVLLKDNMLLMLQYIILSFIEAIVINLYYDYVNSIRRLDFSLENKIRENYILNRKIYKMQEYKQEYINAYKLEERNKLSKQMHDKIGHTMAGAIMQLEAAKIIFVEDSKKGSSMIDNTIVVLRNGMDDIRKTLRQISPESEELGLNRIKVLLTEKLNNTRFSYIINHKGDLHIINATQWKVIVDLVREASTNTLKYSSGDKFKVNIEVLNKVLKVEIKDNGTRINEYKKGLGIGYIEENIAEIGGKLLIDTNAGFSLIVLLPII